MAGASLPKQDQAPRAVVPTIRKFPHPRDQALVDAILRDPFTPAAEHMRRVSGRYDTESLNSAASRASKVLAKPEVQEYLRVQQERIRIAADLEDNDLLQHLAMIIKTDISQVAQWDDEGKVTFTATEALPTHARRAIKKLKTKTTRRYFEKGDMEETVTTELELYSSLDAIEKFAKVAGITGDEGDKTVNNYGVIIVSQPKTEAEAIEGKTIHEG